MSEITKLSDEQINYWTAKAHGWSIIKDSFDDWHGVEQWNTGGKANVRVHEYTPTDNWQQAGELIEKFEIALRTNRYGGWYGIIDGAEFSADNPRKAICLAVIASVYGDEVDNENICDIC